MKFNPRSVRERDVMRYVENHIACTPGIFIWRRNVGKMLVKDQSGKQRFLSFGSAGQSDYFGIIEEITCPICGRTVNAGVHLEIECKRYGGRLTDYQKDWIETVSKLNGIAIVAVPCPTSEDPIGFNAIGRVLDKLRFSVCPDCKE